MDKTTKSNIIWATDAYTELGAAYHRDKEITVDLITGQHSGVIKNRARKALEQQSERTRQHAEVFTPLWICEKMNDHIDEMWFGRKQGIGATETFYSLGLCSTKQEVQNILTYIKTKFARALLSVLKITQDVNPGKWQYVPLQDFTAASDIDWSKSIPEIDKQLYAKYGLDEKEIAFIESHVKEMA